MSKEELNNKEKYWIEYYDSYNNGYNRTTGGTECYISKNYEKIQKEINYENQLKTISNEEVLIIKRRLYNEENPRNISNDLHINYGIILNIKGLNYFKDVGVQYNNKLENMIYYEFMEAYKDKKIKEIIYMVEVEKKSFRQIGDELNITHNTVGNRYNKYKNIYKQYYCICCGSKINKKHLGVKYYCDKCNKKIHNNQKKDSKKRRKG